MRSREFSINCNSNCLLSRKSVIQEINLLLIPYEYNLLIKRLWGTLSKAFSKSVYIQSICPPESKFNVHSSMMHNNCKNSRSRACLDQVLIAIRSFTLLCDHNRSKTRLIAIMNLIAKLGTIYNTACHASLCTATLDCLSVSCHCLRTQPILYTNTAQGGGCGD